MPSTFPPLRGDGNRSHTIYPLLVIPLLAIMLIAGMLAFYLNNQAHAAKADTLMPLANSVPTVVAKSKLVSPVDPNAVISLSIGLRLRNATELDNYIADMNRPKSINYHRHLSSSQIIGAFSPSQATHDALIQYLQAAGFTITQTFKHRMVIGFQGTMGQAERVFHVNVNNYTAPNGQAFYSNATNPLLPSSLVGTVQSISGLNNVTRYHRAPVHMQSGQSAASKIKRSEVQTNTSTSCPTSSSIAFLPNQTATGYDLNGLYNAGYRGEGQTVALFELSQFNMNDINAYRSCFDAGSPTTVQTININGGPPAPNSGGDGGPAEVELDTELILSAAPKLGTIKIYDAANNLTDINLEWGQIVQDAPPVVSTSWGSCEANTLFSQAQTEKNMFAMGVAQGQSFFAASADSGSSGCAFDSTPSTVLSADDPASQPYVTGVGGTALYLNSNNTYNREATWNDQPTNVSLANAQGGASGGGISSFWPSPSWQSAPGVHNSYSTGAPCTAPSGSICREVPDVSLSADPFTSITGAKGYLIYCTEVVSLCDSNHGAPWMDFGGTSCAAPMWAAMTALINEESVKQGGFNIGFLNPLLYQIASGSNYNNDFHDITSGNNDWDFQHNGTYPAASAYDMATGLGSFDAAHLASDLVSLTRANSGTRLAPANLTWYFAEGSVGGGFQEFLTLQNPDPTLASNVTITYLLQGQTPPTATVTKTVLPSSRLTVDVDKDLHTSPAGTHISVAAIVQVTSGPAIVAERPMYFTFAGTIKSGTDVVGATSPGTSYYFPYGNSTVNSTANYSTFVSILNPSATNTAHVAITYYTGSCGATGQGACPTEMVTVAPLQRGTGSPGDQSVVPQPVHQKVAIKVSSDQAVVVERPLYARDYIAAAGGTTTGAASQVGATAPGTDWLFAEGFTGSGFQQYFELANYDPVNAANATIKLEFPNGSTQSYIVSVAAAGFTEFNVNAHAANTPVSAEITSDRPIVADRLMFFHFGSQHYSGLTDVVGTSAAHNVYAFAEGFTANGFAEFLTLQNPTGNNETVAITLFTDSGLVLQQQVDVGAHSRKTVGINGVISFAPSGVAMTVQALGANAVIVAERPMYFDFAGDPGGTDVIGYTGQ
ncbi:MAG: hypothetical protein NVSMB27_18290 [Ktedonobacteraceae bacterium]